MKQYGAHLMLSPESGVEFERRVTKTLIINRLELRNAESYVHGDAAELPDIPVLSYEFHLTFTYFRKKEKREHQSESLKRVELKNEGEEDQLRDWFQKEAIYSRSVMLTSTSESTEMPVFNNITITQLVKGDERSTQVTAIQSSLEGHGNDVIKADRFEAFANNGRKLVESILKMLDPSYTVKCEKTPKEYVVYHGRRKADKIRADILYLCIRDKCKSKGTSSRKEMNVFVLPKRAVLNSFLINWTGKNSRI